MSNIKWDSRFEPQSERGASGTPNIGITFSHSSLRYMLRTLIRDWIDKWPFSEHVLEHDYVFVAALGAWQIHYVHAYFLEGSFNGDGSERSLVLLSSRYYI